jgi:twitching motility protein PilT
MDAPRHRFRREDIEGDASTEGLSPADIRLVSIEEELKTITYSSAIAARDSQALRARVEKLESVSPTDLESTLSKVYDHIETQDDRIEQVFDRLQVLERRLQEAGSRLDNLGEIGRIENLPGLLEQSLVTNLDDLEARFEARLAAMESQGGGASAEEMLIVRQEIDNKNRELRLQIEKLLDSRQNEAVELIENAVRNLRTEELRESVGRDLDLIRSAVVELQEATEYMPSREDLERLEEATKVQGGAGAEEVEAVRAQVQEALTEFGVIKEQLSTIKTLFEGDNWAAKLHEQLQDMKQSATILETHQERVDLAVRLVTQLEEKSRGISFGGGGGDNSDLAPPPGETQLKLTLRDLVREMVKNRVSDLHIKTGRAITARIGKELIQFSTPPLTPADSYHLISTALRPSHRKRLVEERDIEFVYQYESVRLRANVFFDRGNLSATFKMLSNRPPELENLGLPKALSALLGRPSGLILICGLPGSGRTTTLTASLDFLNRTRQLHLVSLEDRLDFAHEDRRSLVTQRELGVDIVSFSQGMHRAIGQDADVIFVSDIADKATMEETFAAVESGLLVVGAVTAQNAEDAIPRLINLFPETERKMRARIFARALQGILALKLFERADGEGQIPASELLVANATVKRLIEDANLSALNAQVAKGGAEGMQTFGQSIERLVETGLIRGEDAARELERLGAVASPRIGAPPVASKPAGAAAAPAAAAVGRSSGETAATVGAAEPVATGQPEAFGEEDTLMNWL